MMRWRQKSCPNAGDIRVVSRFLFFPLCLDGECRWLEVAKIKQTYVQHTAMAPDEEVCIKYWKWRNSHWAEHVCPFCGAVDPDLKEVEPEYEEADWNE